MPFPTYAPWTNPIEQVWRTLYADGWHLQHRAADWERLHTAVQTRLDQANQPSPTMLRSVGLACAA